MSLTHWLEQQGQAVIFAKNLAGLTACSQQLPYPMGKNTSIVSKVLALHVWASIIKTRQKSSRIWHHSPLLHASTTTIVLAMY